MKRRYSCEFDWNAESEQASFRQVLGFPPIAAIDDIINAVLDYSCDAVDALERDVNTMLGTKEDEIAKVTFVGREC